MKKFLFLFSLGISLTGISQTGKQNVSSGKAVNRGSVPAELLTNDSTHWTISTLSTIGYVNTTPGAYYNTYRSGGGMLVKFRFKEGNRYEFMLYVQANTYGTSSETWTHTEGTVTFGTDEHGQPIFSTKAEKGTYRVTKNGSTSSRPVPETDLRGQLSCTYLWQKTMLKDDPNHIYLLMVDLEEHPGANVNVQGSIDPSWVSKFHIPNK